MRASASRRSVMSSTSATEPPFSIGWKVRLSVRPSCFWMVKPDLSAPVRRRSRLVAKRSLSERRIVPAATQSRTQVARGLALAVHRRQVEQLDQPVVDHHHPMFRIEHAQAGRHVVERRIEASGEQRQIAAGDDRVEQRLAQPVGDEPEARRRTAAGSRPKTA